ncbi:hypothetical protein BS17DRAFT_572166 [Gyrodon lividus]|nr:hypothetical protein BS17DRAFT_572166 [Gyrodon lividus]
MTDFRHEARKHSKDQKNCHNTPVMFYNSLFEAFFRVLIFVWIESMLRCTHRKSWRGIHAFLSRRGRTTWGVWRTHDVALRRRY